MRAALALSLAALCGCGPEQASLDGLWRATAIDGQPVGRTDFLIRVRGGRVVGGKDGCNSWAYDMTQRPEPDGTRMVVSDAMACPGIAQRPAYWRALGNGNAGPILSESGDLRLRAGGSEIMARRANQP